MALEEMAYNTDGPSEPPRPARTKIPTVKVPSDECVVHIGRVIEDGNVTVEGDTYYPHVGEQIEILPLMTVGEVINTGKIAGMTGEETDIRVIGSNFDELCSAIAKRVFAWNWTDMEGLPLASPHRNPAVLKELSSEELVYLMGVTEVAPDPETRKNGFGPSENTSLASPMTQSPSQ